MKYENEHNILELFESGFRIRNFFLADPDPGKNEGVSGGGGGGKGKKCFLDFFSRFSRFLTRKANTLNRRNEIVCIAHVLLYKIMIYLFISLPFCPDPDTGRAKTCGSGS